MSGEVNPVGAILTLTEEIEDCCAGMPGWRMEKIANAARKIDECMKDIELLQRDAARWQYVRCEHVRSTGPHMDGTFVYVFGGRTLPRAKSVNEAVDIRMREVIDEW